MGLWVTGVPAAGYTEKTEYAQKHPGVKTTINPAEDNRRKQCKPNETKPNSNS